MMHYSVWKYLLIIAIVLFSLLFSLPNFFGESPALQISKTNDNIIDNAFIKKIRSVLKKENVFFKKIIYDDNTKKSIQILFVSTDMQFIAKKLLEHKLNTHPVNLTCIITLNLLANTPHWLKKIHAKPMYLGLDLRGGIHFLMQLNLKTVYAKSLRNFRIDILHDLLENNIRPSFMYCDLYQINFKFDNLNSLYTARNIVSQNFSYQITDSVYSKANELVLTLHNTMLKKIRENSIKRNIAALSKRINELGIAEPIIQRQGNDRIIVQLAGLQDIARAKNIIGRTATLEARMVNDKEFITLDNRIKKAVVIPSNSELFLYANKKVLLYKDPIITGDDISNAVASFNINHQPFVRIDLNNHGGQKIQQATHNKIGKLMAIVLFDQGINKILTIATIRDELGSQFQITGMESAQVASDLALLLRAGSLAAPMDIVEERAIGSQLSESNIKQGFSAILYGFLAITIFIIVYYQLFGFFSVLALLINVAILISILSLLKATLTLPGIAAIALVLGMAIDSSVLVNERIREELRKGRSPYLAILVGFDRAQVTIFDSNITMLIIGIALLIFGSSVIRGFATVHCIGILTSMFSALVFSRNIVNIWYRRYKKITKISIG